MQGYGSRVKVMLRHVITLPVRHVVYLSALFGDDDVWTIRQEIQNLYDLLKAEANNKYYTSRNV